MEDLTLNKNNKIVGIVQPTYLPWLPFFERILCSDTFIYLDDVKYSKNNFHNRNAIKSQNGRVLLTIPVLYSGNSTAFINEILIDNKQAWNVKHWRTIQQSYAKAPYLEYYEGELEHLYLKPYEKLIDFIMPFIEFLKRELNLTTPCHFSSKIPVHGEKNEKLRNLCHYFSGTHFIVKPETENYHPPEDFSPHGVELCLWQPTSFEYPQLHGTFEPFLSALDYVLNCGPVDFKSVIRRETNKKSKKLFGAGHEIKSS